MEQNKNDLPTILAPRHIHAKNIIPKKCYRTYNSSSGITVYIADTAYSYVCMSGKGSLGFDWCPTSHMIIVFFQPRLLWLSHIISSCQTSRVRGHTKVLDPYLILIGRSEKPSEIEIRPENTTLSRLKAHDTKKAHNK